MQINCFICEKSDFSAAVNSMHSTEHELHSKFCKFRQLILACTLDIIYVINSVYEDFGLVPSQEPNVL